LKSARKAANIDFYLSGRYRQAFGKVPAMNIARVLNRRAGAIGQTEDGGAKFKFKGLVPASIVIAAWQVPSHWLKLLG